MKRRNFVKQTAALSALGAGMMSFRTPIAKIRKVARLQKGDTIGVIVPSSAISRDSLVSIEENLDMLGFQAKLSPNLRLKNGFLAGTDAQRLSDIHAMFSDPEVDGIICGRGGYGSGRLLADIDYGLIARNPKYFMGYSDITCLHMAFYHKAGLITFHGPNANSSYSPFTLGQFQALLASSTAQPYSLGIALDTEDTLESRAYVIRPGKAQGKLLGGNLSLIASLVGTPYLPDFRDSIVFLEDIGEAPYSMDRMLTQLLLAGSFDGAKAVVIGVCADCEVDPEDADYPDTFSLKEVLRERLSGLGIPVVYGLSFGHVANNGVLPVGIEAELDAEAFTLSCTEQVFRD